MSQMIRWLGPFGAVIGTKPLPFDAFLLDEAPLGEWIRIFSFGPSASIVGSSFIGFIPGALAVCSLLWIRKNPILILVASLALYGLLSSFGTHSGLAYINYHLPLINKIREPSRHLVLFVVAASSLTAVAVSSLQRIVPKWAFAILVCAAIGVHFAQMQHTLQGYPDISHTDLTSPANQESQAILSHIQSTEQKSFIKAIGTTPHPMFLGMNSFYFDDSMKTVDGYYNPQRYSNHRRILYLNQQHEDLMKLSGVTHVICGECPENFADSNTTQRGSLSVKKINGVNYPTLYPNVSERNNPFILTSEDGDNKAVSVDGATPQKLLSAPQVPESISTETDTTNYKRFIVRAGASSLFVADNLFSSNWKYFVNGREVSSYPVNFMRQGIILSKGKATVEMRYTPRFLSVLFLVSGVGAILFVAVLALKKTPFVFRKSART